MSVPSAAHEGDFDKVRVEVSRRRHSASLRTGAVARFGFQRRPQTLEPPLRPGFHGWHRNSSAHSHLFMSPSFDNNPANGVLLHDRQIAQRPFQVKSIFHRFGGNGDIRPVFFRREITLDLAGTAKVINGYVAHDPGHPGQRKPACRIIVSSTCPDAQKGFLQRVFSRIAAPHELDRLPEEAGRNRIVEAFEGAPVTTGDQVEPCRKRGIVRTAILPAVLWRN